MKQFYVMMNIRFRLLREGVINLISVNLISVKILFPKSFQKTRLAVIICVNIAAFKKNWKTVVNFVSFSIVDFEQVNIFWNSSLTLWLTLFTVVDFKKKKSRTWLH